MFILFLILLNALFVTAECSLGRIRRAQLQEMKEQGVSAEFERLISKQFLPAGSANIVCMDWLEMFRESDLMKEILNASRVRRELQFRFFLPLSELTQNSELKKQVEDETIFVQGSIDLLLETADGRLILCDYKTDSVSEFEREHPDSLLQRFRKTHGEQLAIYAKAVRRLFGKDPDRILIYSLPLGRALQLS